MPTDTAFRVSTYLTLALSCLCIGYAEWDVLPEVGFIACATLIAFIVLFRLETRVELLSIAAANRLGLILGFATFVWGGGRLIWEQQHNEFQNMPWPLMLAAMFGLLLITAMPAKLARREKHAGDYWWLHGMGLVGVCLAGAIAEDPICFFLILFYSACAAWSLSLFHLRQAGGAILPMPGKSIATPIGSVIAASSRQLGLRRTAGFILAAAAAAVPLYLVTPRSPYEKLTFGQPRVEIGFAADQMTDLNQTGDLKANEAVAFEVVAEANGQPKTDLSPEQRWRGRILKQYVKGVWRDTPEHRLPQIVPSSTYPIVNATWSPPDLGAGQFTLTFTVPSRHWNGFQADPIVWAGDQPAPIATLTPSGPRGWRWLGDGSFFWFSDGSLLSNPRPKESDTEGFRYRQEWRPGNDPDSSAHLSGSPS